MYVFLHNHVIYKHFFFHQTQLNINLYNVPRLDNNIVMNGIFENNKTLLWIV